MRTRRSPMNQDRLFRVLGKQKAPMIPCKWKDDGEGNWDTSCGETYIILEGTPEENKMKFCPYCGKPLTQVLYAEEPLFVDHQSNIGMKNHTPLKSNGEEDVPF